MAPRTVDLFHPYQIDVATTLTRTEVSHLGLRGANLARVLHPLDQYRVLS
jgi:hypothetical protein